MVVFATNGTKIVGDGWPLLVLVFHLGRVERDWVGSVQVGMVYKW